MSGTSINVLSDTSLFQKNKQDLQDLEYRTIEETAILNEKWLTSHNFEKITLGNGDTFYHHKEYKLSVYLEPFLKIEWLGFKINCLFNIKSLKEFIFTIIVKDFY